MNQTRNEVGNLLIGDLILLLMLTVLLSSTYFLASITLAGLPLIFQVLGCFLIFYLMLCFFALIMPKVPPGIYPMMSSGMIKWFIGFIFGRIWHFPLIQYPIFNFVLLRTIFLKCLGCKVGFKAAISSDIGIYDPHLIEIGEHVVIGMRSIMIPHFIAKGKLVLGTIKVADYVSIGGNAEIMCNTSFGEGVTTDLKLRIFAGTHIPKNVKVKSFCILDKTMKFKEGETIPPYTRPENFK